MSGPAGDREASAAPPVPPFAPLGDAAAPLCIDGVCLVPGAGAPGGASPWTPAASAEPAQPAARS